MIRQRVSLAVAGAFVASSAFTLGIVSPASAAATPYDPTFAPTTGDLVGVGSDTSEIVLDYLTTQLDGHPDAEAILAAAGSLIEEARA